MSTAKTDHLFIKACFGEAVERAPVWMMRQAGRYLPQYREVRKKYDFIAMYKTPEVAAQVTLQPVDILKVDAAILFSDILVIPEAMGMELIFTEGRGPQFTAPIRQQEQLSDLKPVDAETDLKFVLDAIRIIRQQLEGKVPLIGFSGAPWTLATYMIEGGGSKNFRHAKEWRFSNTRALSALLEKITEAVINYCQAQIRAGAQAIQLFDSWAGILDEAGFIEFALPYVQEIIRTIRVPGVPIIYFAKGAAMWLEHLKASGADVIALDWTVRLSKARKILGEGIAIQGNLDPIALYSKPGVIRKLVREMLTDLGDIRGYVGNLGHGILPDIPVEHAREFIIAIKEESAAMVQSQNNVEPV